MNVVNLNSASLNSKRLNVIGDIRSSAEGGGGGDKWWDDNYISFRFIEGNESNLYPQLYSSISGAEYSINNGEWTPLGSYIYPNFGDVIRVRAKAVPSGNNGIGLLKGRNQYFEVAGNTMSLLFGDEAEGKVSLEGYNWVFRSLLGSDFLIDASNLLLPATMLSQRCYQQLFEGSKNLIGAPQLPATTLAEGCYFNMFLDCQKLQKAPDLLAETTAAMCYYYMFNGCKSLQYIKAMHTNEASQAMLGWVGGVAPTGVFVKNSKATWTTTGDNGVPSGWTIEYADA